MTRWAAGFTACITACMLHHGASTALAGAQDPPSSTGGPSWASTVTKTERKGRRIEVVVQFRYLGSLPAVPAPIIKVRDAAGKEWPALSESRGGRNKECVAWLSMSGFVGLGVKPMTLPKEKVDGCQSEVLSYFFATPVTATMPLALVFGDAPPVPLALGDSTPEVDADGPTKAARQLVERRAAVDLPLNGKSSRKLEEKDETFLMPDGRSRVLLWRLPEYHEPYGVLVQSFTHQRSMSRTVKALVPTILLLDAEYHVTRIVGDDAIEYGRAGGTWSKPSLHAGVLIAEANRDERFLLVYTNGAAVGEPLRLPDLLMGFRAERSADGQVELETRTRK